MLNTLKIGWLALFVIVIALAGTSHPAHAQDLDMKKIFRCTATDAAGTAACDQARDLILNNCTSCHAFVPIVLQQFDEAGWKGLFDRHKSRAPQLSDQQIAQIETYLAANFNAKYPPPELPAELLKQWTAY